MFLSWDDGSVDVLVEIFFLLVLGLGFGMFRGGWIIKRVGLLRWLG